MPGSQKLCLLFLFNIPSEYHAAHLRIFFSQNVESQNFVLFHFRHRAEPSESVLSPSPIIHGNDLLKSLQAKIRKPDRCCAFIVIHLSRMAQFIKSYHNTHWLDSNDSPLTTKCQMSLVTLQESDWKAFQQLLEFNQPRWMPRGNVGTPTSHFFQLIKSCQLSASLIGQLKLDFAKCKSGRIYGSVPYNYEMSTPTTSVPPARIDDSSHVTNQHGIRLVKIIDNDQVEFDAESRDHTIDNKEAVKLTVDHSDQSSESSQPPFSLDSDEPGEEWERFEALHDDPYDVTRASKANIKYERPIELVWEKGGSGLVFYTDEQAWRESDPLRGEEMFDEPASFDWDIDMQPYDEQASSQAYAPGPGYFGHLRDTAELIDIGRQRQLIPPLPPSLSYKPIGEKNFGHRLMSKLGWKPGMRLGTATNRGLAEPLSHRHAILPLPHNRPGLGYHGSKADRRPTLAHSHSSVRIGTVFDQPPSIPSGGEAPEDIVKLRRNIVVKAANHNAKLIGPSFGSSTTYPTDRTVVILPPDNSDNRQLGRQTVKFVFGGYSKS